MGEAPRFRGGEPVMTQARLIAEHRAIQQIADGLMAIIEAPTIEIDELTRWRMTFAMALRDHLASEERQVLTPLRQCGAVLPSAVARVIGDIRRKRAEFSEHVRLWTPQRIMRQPADYRRDCRRLFAELNMVAAAEERILYPYAYAALIPQD